MLTVNRSSLRGGAVGWGLPAAVAILGGIALYSLVNLSHERSRAQQLAAANQGLSSTLQQVQGEMQTVTDKLNTLASQPAPPPAPPERPARRAVQQRVHVAAAPAPVRSAADQARLRQIEANLADQQKAIADTRQQADEDRLNLQGQMTSQHDELTGSIAKNHDELVDLEKRGERNFYEFDLDKSKQFQHVGPLGLSLRRVNVKHKYYDLVLLVDDQQLEKKHVDLYEPLMFTVADRPQPIELVVNSIKGNEVRGYVSEPKYKSEPASTSTSANTSTSTSTSPSVPPPAQPGSSKALPAPGSSKSLEGR